jgi:hypothetical protein
LQHLFPIVSSYDGLALNLPGSLAAKEQISSILIQQPKPIPFSEAQESDLRDKGYEYVAETFCPDSASIVVKLSAEFEATILRMNVYFAMISEADRRTWIDIVLLEALWSADQKLGKKRKVLSWSNFSVGAKWK